MNILVVEDDAELAADLIRKLEARGHEAVGATDGKRGFAIAAEQRFDAIVLDRMLPEWGGVEVLRALRASGVATPVLFLTNMSGIDERVEGLEAGGDDYLVKPFVFEELLARLTALARRPTLGAEATTLAALDLEMDLIRRTVRRGGELIDLQPREFQLLEFFLRSEGRVVTRKMLLEKVWNFHFDPRTNIVETHVSRLRAKLDRDGAKPLIHNIRGAGYALRAL